MGGCEPVRIKHLAAGCATALLIPRGTAAGDPPARLYVFWNDRLPLCRDSRYDLRRGRRLKSFAPGLRRRAGCLGWRDNPLLESARWPFLFAGFRRTLMLGVGGGLTSMLVGGAGASGRVKIGVTLPPLENSSSNAPANRFVVWASTGLGPATSN